MFRNYFKIAWRNIVRTFSYSILNILGLSTGMAVALIIGLWAYYQFSYDRFLPDNGLVYKVGKLYVDKGEKKIVMATPQPLAAALKQDVPGIQYVARTDWMKQHGLMAGETKLYVSGGMVDADFLKIFQYHLLEGSANDVFKDPYSIVLTQSTATALFGKTDAISKTVRIDNQHDLKVTGIIEDVPTNSTLQFNFLVPFTYYIKNNEGVKTNADNWSNLTFQTFVALQPKIKLVQIQPALNTLLAKYNAEEYKQSKSVITMQPMKNWHLYTEFEHGVETGFITYVKTFCLIGALVLLIACINFINLSTASSERRAREVGVRKAMGSLKSQLILQFLVESVVIVFVAFVISVLLVQLALPAFNLLTSSSINIPYTNGTFWLVMIVYILLTGLIAGSRPAFYLSSFNPVKVLKGVIAVGEKKLLPRQVMVIVQFTCSVSLIISTVIIYRQVQYAKDRPIGYDATRLVMTDANEDLKRNYNALKNELLASGFIAGVTKSSSPVTDFWNYNSIDEWQGRSADESVGVASVNIADANYFATLGMQLKAGRNFTGDADSINVIINETAVKQMRLKEPVNQIISWGGNEKPVRIIAIVNDVLMSSPFAKPQATLFTYDSDRAGTVTYRLKTNVDVQEAMSAIGTIFNKYNPSLPYLYNYTDEVYAAKFKQEFLIGKLAGLFAVLAILISCVGLFGLAAYTAAQRNKEIGIRKILGASAIRIWLMLSKEFVKLVIISCFIATPVALYFLTNWLQQYDYRISIGADVFIFSSLTAILITIATVSFQSIKAAIANPIKSLKTE